MKNVADQCAASADHELLSMLPNGVSAKQQVALRDDR
jgi:hypothetical protein